MHARGDSSAWFSAHVTGQETKTLHVRASRCDARAGTVTVRTRCHLAGAVTVCGRHHFAGTATLRTSDDLGIARPCTWVKNDPPRLNASLHGSLSLSLHLLPHFQAGVIVVSQVLHGLWVTAHVHQDVRHIQLRHLFNTPKASYMYQLRRCVDVTESDAVWQKMTCKCIVEA